MTNTDSSISLAQANQKLFRRYGEIILRARARGDGFEKNPRLSLNNLAWMCREGARNAPIMPDDKTSRWIGFIQGCLAMRDLIDVDTERDLTRPLFHGVTAGLGKRPDITRENKSAD